jgi:hypothetical protein
MKRSYCYTTLSICAVLYHGIAIAGDNIGAPHLQIATYSSDHQLGSAQQDRLLKIQSLESRLIASTLSYADAWKVASAHVDQALATGNDDKIENAYREQKRVEKTYRAESCQLNHELLAALKSEQ